MKDESKKGKKVLKMKGKECRKDHMNEGTEVLRKERKKEGRKV